MTIKKEGRPAKGGQQTNFTLVILSDVPPSVKRTEWGPVRLNRETLCLEVDTGHSGYKYEIFLEECCSSAQVLDWICQVSRKTWATDKVIAGLVHGINGTLNPQATLCSCGRDKRLTQTEIRRAVGGHE